MRAIDELRIKEKAAGQAAVMLAVAVCCIFGAYYFYALGLDAGARMTVTSFEREAHAYELLERALTPCQLALEAVAGEDAHLHGTLLAWPTGWETDR